MGLKFANTLIFVVLVHAERVRLCRANPRWRRLDVRALKKNLEALTSRTVRVAFLSPAHRHLFKLTRDVPDERPRVKRHVGVIADIIED